MEVDRGAREPCDLVVVSSAGAGTGDTASDDAVAVFEGDAQVELRDELSEAEGPVRAGKPRPVRAHHCAQHDQ